MRIDRLTLQNFRNYTEQSVAFAEDCNVIVGENAQGKTNLIEAVVYLSCARSGRARTDRELIRFGEETARLHGEIFSREREFVVEMDLFSGKRRKIQINQVPAKRASELTGVLGTVFFCPEDLDIIRRGPGVRRHFLDMDISRINSLYLNQLLGYNKVLESRNKLLKKINFDRKESDIKTLDILDEQLVSLGIEVINERIKYIEKLNVLISSIHASLSGKTEDGKIIYEPQTTIEIFAKELERQREKDIRTGQTNTGPHRDDFTFSVNGADVKKYGSQGQKRTAALSLKLAQIDIAKNMTGELPVLLLDDVLSELDFKRQSFLLERIGNMQTIITCTGRDSLIKQEFNVDRIFKVNEGKVSQER